MKNRATLIATFVLSECLVYIQILKIWPESEEVVDALRHPVEEKYSLDASCKLGIIQELKKQPGSVDIKKSTSNTYNYFFTLENETC